MQAVLDEQWHLLWDQDSWSEDASADETAAKCAPARPGDHRVECHVPQLPYTAEVEAFDRLKRQPAAYRVVFGQPGQEELVTLLDRLTRAFCTPA